jgi:hypothetical protein
MRLPKLDVLIGHVLKVQLSTETHVAGQASETMPLSVRSSVVNRMRVFLRTAEGKERDVALANATIGVREGHHLAIALAKPPGAQMQPVMMVNLTTGQREEFREAFTAAARQKIIDARWRAGAAALILGVGFYLFAHLFQPQGEHALSALAIAALGFGGLWGIFAAGDAMVLPRQEKALIERLKAEIEGRIAIAERGREPPAKTTPAEAQAP